MAIEGRLRELALSDVIQLLELSGQTGMLSVAADAGERRSVLWFERGAIAGAEASNSDNRLGRLLLRSGALDEISLRKALASQRAAPGSSLGALIVRLGLARAEEVARCLCRQVEQTVLDVLRWDDGTFRFDEGRVRPDGGIRVRVPVGGLLLEAARHSDEWVALGPRIPHGEVVPALAVSAGAAPLELDPIEWELLAEVDGERSLRQLADDLGASDLEVAKTLGGLLGQGVVVLVETAPGGPGQAAREGLARELDPVEQLLRQGLAADAVAAAESLAAARPEAAEARLLAGRARLAARSWTEAADHLARAVQLDPLAAEAHFHLGIAAARTGDLQRAQQAWGTFLRLPDAARVQVETAREALVAVSDLIAALDAAPT